MFVYLMSKPATSHLLNNRSNLWWYRRAIRQNQPSAGQGSALDMNAPDSDASTADLDDGAVLAGRGRS